MTERPPKKAKFELENHRIRPIYSMASLVELTVELNPQEEKLFHILSSSVEKSDSGTIVRVAGGWVRDKLLGMENDDIDVALDNLSGVAFASLVNKYLEEEGQETHKIGVIQANPDQSKHLETARVKILGGWVDCVNLRTETYQDNSRIPEIRFGTAEEDAYRRDFTINALFYNVNTRQVEDFTGQGMPDLSAGIVRTPLPPTETFLDDPLRVMRAIRFASRFAFNLSEELSAAARDPVVQQALAQKVSRERVGVELEGMLSGKLARPALAMGIIHDLNLFPIIFAPPPGLEMPENAWDVSLKASRYANRLIKMQEEVENPADRLGSFIQNQAIFTNGELILEPQRSHRLTYLACAVLPLMNHFYLDKKKKQQPVVAYISRESLKLKNKDGSDLSTIATHLEKIKELAQRCCPEPIESGEGLTRLELGLLLRDLKDLWRVGFQLACISELCDIVLPVEEQYAGIEKVLTKYFKMEEFSQAWNLDLVWKQKPLHDGKTLMESLEIPKGPNVGKVMQLQVRWQLENPDGTPEECMSFLCQLKSEGSLF
mmetsp:Transcript_23792/g.31106  ORF Transcript_23792/g.31106 Transcript_23792/m.31106 type:complete len:546 (-) Transcript_23792:441-2078(-)|eukprot:CAMPEP_0117830840 /NCGR_PEP_ID=MMETSP0949-20121206/8748_1 /TAXON_ID=44440 /ORGANISM="Chattonella subsalsa, Strain CCMP2191" /LENGTH=545 /DNA_ID=CAMNT_0005671953 /DNA_START=42 /DNA_END=1679 /DNA_ORIENTATION=+